MNTALSLIILSLLGFIWGSGYTLAKYAMTHEVPPLGYAFWQSLGPSLLLTTVTILRGNLQWLKPCYWKFYLVCGLLGIVIPNTNMYLISSHLPAGILAVLVNTVPIIIYPLALLNRQEYFDPWRLLSLCIGMLGIVLIIAPTKLAFPSGWAILALLSPLCFALCGLYISSRQPFSLTPLESASGMLLAATCLLFPLIVQQNSFFPLSFPLTINMQVIVLEIILSSLGYFLYFKLIKIAGAVFYSLIGGIVALTGLFWGFIVFQEKPNLQQMVAIIFVIAAIFLLSSRQSTQQAQ